MNRFTFGISSWSYPWSIGVKSGPQPERKMTALELLEKAKSLGVGLVQIADNLPLENFSGEELESLVEFANKNNIKIEVGTKGTDPEHMMLFLDIAKKLRSPIVRTLPALFGKKAVLEEVRTNIIDVIPEYEKAGITIVLENTEAFKAIEYVHLMESIDHPNFRMCVDLANALGTMEGPEYVMDELLPFCGNYHIKDVEVVRSQTLMGFSVNGKPTGQGQIPLKSVLEKLKQSANYPSVIIELWPPLLDSIEETIQLEHRWVEESVAFMQTMLPDFS